MTKNWTLQYDKGGQTSTFFNAIWRWIIMFCCEAEQHTQSRLKHTHTARLHPLKPGYPREQSSSSSPKTSDNRGATHPEDDGVGEQEEFEQNVGEPVTVSDLFVVGHRVWLRAVDRQRLPALLSTLPRCHRHHTWERALPSWMDGRMDGRKDGWFMSVTSLKYWHLFV